MAKVIFYEKPGCGGNARQKALLRSSGHEVDARSLLAEPWTVAALRPFMAGKTVQEYFNPASPRIKSGEIDPQLLTADAALALLVEDPLLIRRPLMRVGDRCEAGFDQAKVDAWIGLRKTLTPVTDVCRKEHGARDERCRPQREDSRA